MITIYKVDGSVEVCNDKAPPLEHFQEWVGGYVEIVPARLHPFNGKLMIVNEEGMMRGMPRNPISDTIGWEVLGNVVVCDKKDFT